MKDINNFISEKLKLDKNIKIEKNKYIPTEEDYKKLSVLFDTSFRKSGYSEWECEDLAKKCTHATTCLRMWLALQIMTKSTPYIYKGTIHSFPGNYGMPFIDKLIDHFGIDIKEIIDQYDIIKDDNEKEIPQALNDHYGRMIVSLLNNFDINIRKHFKVEFKQLIPDENNYSMSGQVLLDTKKQIEIIPFDITYKGKTIRCEIAVRGSAYFNYVVNHKTYRLSSEFKDAIAKEFNI